MALMGCEDGYECCVRRLPQYDVRRQVQYVRELDAAAIQRIESVFQRGVKAWACMLLPDLKMKCDSDIKITSTVQSIATPTDEPATSAVGNEVPLLPVPSTSIPMNMLSTIPITIRDMLKYKKRYTSTDARTLLVPPADVSQAYIASLLKISNNYAGRLHFQAKVDKLYLTEGVALQEYKHSRYCVCSTVVNSAVDFIYADENISCLLWEAKKCYPNRDLRWKELANVFAMRSLVLKHDIATIYRQYLVKQKVAMPEKPPIGKSMLYTIANITGGGKQQ